MGAAAVVVRAVVAAQQTRTGLVVVAIPRQWLHRKRCFFNSNPFLALSSSPIAKDKFNDDNGKDNGRQDAQNHQNQDHDRRETPTPSSSSSGPESATPASTPQPAPSSSSPSPSVAAAAAAAAAETPPVKRKPRRATTTKNSLRRVAIIAQRQPSKREPSSSSPPPVYSNNNNHNYNYNHHNNNNNNNTHHITPTDASSSSSSTTSPPTIVSAICVAEAFDMPTVVDILTSHGFAIDPDRTGFDTTELVHAKGVNGGDIFVFPSGTVVTWALPPDVVTRQLLPAAETPHPPQLREAEDLDFTVDTSRADSAIVKGDLVVLGTRREHRHGDTLDTTLAKIAFSSGLARSTKLAVLETALTTYFETTRAIPALLSRGQGGLPLKRRFILQKTGELLSLRARLNHYSELTDSLPDIFWDSRAELGLEGYYDQVGRALDVSVRIRTLNQKMDYAQEIATVLRELSSEQHGTRLELIIILLIAVEVVFELRRILLESFAEKKEAVPCSCSSSSSHSHSPSTHITSDTPLPEHHS